MAYYNKDVYDGKAAYAARKMQENREVENTLTDEQKDALEELCAIRHRVHADPRAAENLFCSQSCDYDEYWSFIGSTCCDNYIKGLLADAGLPCWDWHCDELAYTTDADEDLEITNEVWDDCIMRLAGLVNAWNNSIEAYLAAIDRANDTEYCPTGLSRE